MDPPTSKWIKQLLLDLKDTVFRLKKERGEAVVDEVGDEHLQDLELRNQSLQRQLVNMDAELEGKKKELLKKEEELLNKDKELEAMQKQLDGLQLKMNGTKNNGCSTCYAIGFVIVLGLLAAILMNGTSK